MIKEKEKKPRFSSPACALDEAPEGAIDPAYLGQLRRGEILALLNELRPAVRRYAPKFDEGIRRKIRRHGGNMRKTVAALSRSAARGKIQEALPRIGDDALHVLLRDILTALEIDRAR
jgi:hypothetical protein